MKRWPTDDWQFLSWHYRALHIQTAWHNPLVVRARGVDNIPRTGPFLFVANHSSWWDPIALACCSGRPVNFLGKKEVFRGPFTNWFFGRGGVIPVDRKNKNPEAMAAALQALRDGRVIGVFPEGTRHVGTLGPVRPGAAKLALQTGAPIVPVGVLSDEFWGPGRKLPRLHKKVRVNIGRPMQLAGDPDDAGAVQKGMDQVMSAVEVLLQEAREARERKEKWATP